MKRIIYRAFEDCENCEGKYCKDCRERSEGEYEEYLDGKREEALARMRGEEQ